MSTIVLPRFLSIDTSSLGKMADDFWSGNELRRRRATETIERLSADNWVIVLMLEHVQELVQHENDSVAYDRVRFLRRLPLVATLKTSTDSLVGSAFDIDCREIDAIVNGSMQTRAEIISYARDHCWNFFTGDELVGEFEDSWESIRDRTSPLLSYSIDVASISRSGDPDVLKIKLEDVSRKPLPNSSQAQVLLTKLARDMESRLKQHGDKRLHECRSLATEFHREIWTELTEMSQDGEDVYSSMLRHYGVDPAYVTPEMTVADLGDLAVFVKVLARATQRLRLSDSLSLSDVWPDDLPSWSLRRALRDNQNTAERVRGSDLLDTHFAPLACYADAVQVDRRTLGYLQRIEPLRGTGRHFKVPNYWDIPTAVMSFSDRNVA